jgi:hypothetical protein
MRLSQVSIGILVLFALLALTGWLPPPARSGSSCGQAVIADWRANGVIDRTYPPGCYTRAVRELPEDARIYSSAESDILAALARTGAPAPPHRLLQQASVPVGAASVVPATHSPSLRDAAVAALAVAAVVALIPLAVALRRRATSAG